jgi:hypothetical protein
VTDFTDAHERILPTYVTGKKTPIYTYKNIHIFHVAFLCSGCHCDGLGRNRRWDLRYIPMLIREVGLTQLSNGFNLILA